MTLQLARTEPERFDYLVQLSGFAHAATHDGDNVLAEREPRIPAFQAWGSDDPIIDPSATERTVGWMREHLAAEQHEYTMPHAVIPDEVADIAAFIRRQITD